MIAEKPKLFGCKPVGLQPVGVLPELHYVMFVCPSAQQV